MKKFGLMVVLAMALSSGSFADTNISNLSGQSCGDLTGTWHFVNNQTGGAAAGILTAYFSGDPSMCVTGPSKVLPSVQHFYCYASGGLTGASTTLPGRLVLSDFSCASKCTDPKGCEPPK